MLCFAICDLPPRTCQNCLLVIKNESQKNNHRPTCAAAAFFTCPNQFTTFASRALTESRWGAETLDHRPSQRRVPAPDYSPPVFQLKEADGSGGWITLTNSHTSIPRRLKSLLIQPQAAGVISDRNIISALVVHIWVCFYSGIISVPKVVHRNLSSGLHSCRRVIVTTSF